MQIDALQMHFECMESRDSVTHFNIAQYNVCYAMECQSINMRCWFFFAFLLSLGCHARYAGLSQILNMKRKSFSLTRRSLLQQLLFCVCVFVAVSHDNYTVHRQRNYSLQQQKVHDMNNIEIMNK